jgi:flavin reductase (DIM6/NTAB) family NADH-FMN oxidoreductase RutF
MKINLGSKPFLFPMPVLLIASYNEDGTANAMTAAWGSLSDVNQIAIYLGSAHKSVKNILARKAYTVAITDQAHVDGADYVGSVSGFLEANKVEKAGFHPVPSQSVDAPILSDMPMTLECKLVSYDEETELALGEIVNIIVDDSILDANGNIDPIKLKPVSYDPVNRQYLAIASPIAVRRPKVTSIQ